MPSSDPRCAPLNLEARRARARLGAYRRWDGTDPAELDRLTQEYLNAANRSDTDGLIDALIENAPRMTAAQVARIRRWANAEPPAADDSEAVAS